MQEIMESTRLVLLRTCILLSVLLCGAGMGASRAAGQEPQRPASSRIIAGGDRDCGPIEFLDASGRPSGFTVELLRAVGRAAGREVEFRLGPWATSRKALSEGKIDVLAMLKSEERAQDVDFSEPHSILYQILFVRRGTDEFGSLDDLAGKQVIVQRGAYPHDYLRRTSYGAELVLVDTEPEAVRLLASGRHDCALVTRVGGRHAILKSKLTNITSGSSPLLPREYCFAVRKGNAKLLGQIDQGLRLIKATGEYDQIYDKWLGGCQRPEVSYRKMLRKAAWVFMPLAAVAVLAVVWVRTLRRQVAARTSELEQSNRALKALSGCNRLMVQIKDESKLCQEVCNWIVKACGYCVVWIGLVEGSGGGGVRVVASAVAEDGSPTPADTGPSLGDELTQVLAAAAVRTGRPQVMPDVSSHLCEGPLRERANELGMASAVTLPLLAEGKVLGVLGICAGSRNAFGEEETDLLTTMSHDLAHAAVTLRAQKEQHRTRRSLADAEEKGATLFDSGLDGILVAESESKRFVAANGKMCELLGYALEELLALGLADIYPENDLPHVVEQFERQVRGEITLAENLPVKRKDGTVFHADVNAMRVRWGGHKCLLGVFRDTTEWREVRERLKQAEEQFRQAQKLEAVGQLASGVAHDFNNLLMVQMGYCELAKSGLRDEDPLAEDLAQIMACAERAAALTRQLLAFSRKQVLQPEVLDLNAVVANIEKMLRRLIGEDIELTAMLADGLWNVKGDPGQIEQVIMNLAVNARDAMPQGGKLTIETANVELDEDYARSHVSVTAGAHVMLAVTDTGCGMDEGTKSRIFEPFFTTKAKEKGTGLGLATVYGMVKQSGGNIWVYSEPGKGTAFKIYLPRVEAEAVSRASREVKATRGGGELVLVVEDEPVLRDLFARMIEGLGYRVKVAANGGEALITVEEEGLKPDLLITDVVMPGMSGRVLAERLCRAQPGLKVLYTSGYTDNAIVHHGLLDSGTPFIQKPFIIGDLAAKVEKLLRA